MKGAANYKASNLDASRTEMRAIQEAVLMSAENRVYKEMVGMDGAKIVLLDWNGQSPKFVNMQKIGSGGVVLWTATPDHPLEGVWTDAHWDNGNIKAHNYAGFSDLIDYETGRIIQRKFVK